MYSWIYSIEGGEDATELQLSYNEATTEARLGLVVGVGSCRKCRKR